MRGVVVVAALVAATAGVGAAQAAAARDTTVVPETVTTLSAGRTLPPPTPSPTPTPTPTAPSPTTVARAYLLAHGYHVTTAVLEYDLGSTVGVDAITDRGNHLIVTLITPDDGRTWSVLRLQPAGGTP